MHRDELFAYRHQICFSVLGLAKATGYDQRTVARWESGLVRIPASAQIILRVMMHSEAGLQLICRLTGAGPSQRLASYRARLERRPDTWQAVKRRPGRPHGSKGRPAPGGEGTRAGG